MKNTKLQEIGKRIAKLRKEKNLTQQELANLIYVSDKTISKWERGVGAPDLSILESLATNLGVTVQELICGSHSEKSNHSTIDGIKLYVNENKKGIFKKYIKIFACVIFAFILIYLADNYNKWKVTYFESKGDFNVMGYSFHNNKETKVIFDKIVYNSELVGTIDEPKTNYLKVSLYCGEKELYYKESYFDEMTYFHECFENYALIYESNKKISDKELQSLFLRIEYKDEDEKIKNTDIFLFNTISSL